MSHHKLKIPDPLTRQQEATKRRELMLKAQLPTFILLKSEAIPVIVCLCCGAFSYNPNDILHLYCGNCHLYQYDPAREGGILP